jgi:hypothetical protein
MALIADASPKRTPKIAIGIEWNFKVSRVPSNLLCTSLRRRGIRQGLTKQKRELDNLRKVSTYPSYSLSLCGHVVCVTCLQEWFRKAPAIEDEMYDNSDPMSTQDLPVQS